MYYYIMAEFIYAEIFEYYGTQMARSAGYDTLCALAWQVRQHVWRDSAIACSCHCKRAVELRHV